MRLGRLDYSKTYKRIYLCAPALVLLCLSWHAPAEETFPPGTIAIVETDYYPDYDGTTIPGVHERNIKQNLPAGIRISGEDASYKDRWFRAAFYVDRTMAEPQSVYFPNVIQNVAVYLDGNLVGASAELDRPTKLNWNMPQLFVLPAHSLSPGNHDLHIRIYTGIGGTGRLAPFALGPLSELSLVHQRRAWAQFYGPQAISLAVALIGTISFLLWLRRRDETAFGYFALVCVIWIVRNMHLIKHEPALPAFIFYVVTHSSAVWLSAAIYVFCFRMLEKRFPRVEMAWWIYATICTLALSFTDRVSFWPIARAMLAPPQLAAVVLVAYLGWQLWIRREADIMLLLIATTGTVLLGIYDTLLWQNKLPFPRIYLMPYASLLFVAVAGWALVDRFVRAQSQFEQLNRELENRVRDRETELAQNYAKLADLERERTIVTERQRILRDIHDGLGSQLLTSISLVERGQMQSGEVAAVLRECVDDLRLAIDSLRPTGADLLAVLGNLRYRLEPRLAAAGIEMVWYIHDTPSLPPLNSESVLNIMRMVQEALTNTVKHARASKVNVTLKFDETTKRHCLSISDNGCGFDTQNHHRGDGLRNMQMRAHKGYALVTVESSEKGTCVAILLPNND
jgi:signal transduction histidine kinase